MLNSWISPAALGLSLALAACAVPSGVNVESDHTGEAAQALDVGQLVASTTRVNLGEVAVGSSSRALVTLTNIGRVRADLKAIRIVPPDPYRSIPPDPYEPSFHNPPADLSDRYGDFSAVALLPAVQPQETQSLTIGFSPTAVGAQHVAVVASYTDGTGEHELTITVDAFGIR
jgi:hypothetical protein